MILKNPGVVLAFGGEVSIEEVYYQAARDIIPKWNILNGYSATVLIACGAAGAGKTFTKLECDHGGDAGGGASSAASSEK